MERIPAEEADMKKGLLQNSRSGKINKLFENFSFKQKERLKSLFFV